MAFHLLTIADLTPAQLAECVEYGIDFKKNPEKYADVYKQKTMLMLFEKPSLRTRVSFETGMTRLGGHAIFYDMSTSPLGKGKESIKDTANVLSRMVDVVMARLNTRQAMHELAEHSTIPVINALDDFAHPCQMLAHAQTVVEQLGLKGVEDMKNLKLAFPGDTNNNVTYDLMRLYLVLGARVSVAGPDLPEFAVEAGVIEECNALAAKFGGSFHIGHDLAECVDGANVVYCDSWSSYHLDQTRADERKAMLMPFQVTMEAMKGTAKGALFCNCLPASENEQTHEVLYHHEGDDFRSVIFDEAENRLYAQVGYLIWLSKQE